MPVSVTRTGGGQMKKIKIRKLSKLETTNRGTPETH
jgi:hypothetical protein